MGSFGGHALPGSIFFLFGLWWTTQVMRRHIRSRQVKDTYHSTLIFPFPYCPGRPRCRTVPVEPIVKIFLCCSGIIVELLAGINPATHRFDSIGNTQHITMYAFFTISGILDILVLKDLAPAGVDYAGMMVALLVEGALFKFHLYGRDQLDVLLHTLLLYVIGFSVVVVGLEAAYRKATILPMLRGLLFMQQGTWFWAVAVILYNPVPTSEPWDPEDHHHLMLAVVIFSWHLVVNLILVIAVGGVTACCYRNEVRYSQLSTVPFDVLKSGEEEEEELLQRRQWSGRNGGNTEYRDDVGSQKKNGAIPVSHHDDLSDLEVQVSTAT